MRQKLLYRDQRNTLAGSHLLDPESGEYNFAYIKQYLPDAPVVVVTLLRREQGLIVAQGNPKNIASLKDLARSDVRFVNRQRGAGTRVLLDYRLKELGITAGSVHGYQHEEYTHLAVAAAAQSGVAGCGLGVRAAARALDLDFVSVEWERVRSRHSAAVLGIRVAATAAGIDSRGIIPKGGGRIGRVRCERDGRSGAGNMNGPTTATKPKIPVATPE